MLEFPHNFLPFPGISWNFPQFPVFSRIHVFRSPIAYETQTWFVVVHNRNQNVSPNHVTPTNRNVYFTNSIDGPLKPDRQMSMNQTQCVLPRIRTFRSPCPYETMWRKPHKNDCRNKICLFPTGHTYPEKTKCDQYFAQASSLSMRRRINQSMATESTDASIKQWIERSGDERVNQMIDQSTYQSSIQWVVEWKHQWLYEWPDRSGSDSLNPRIVESIHHAIKGKYYPYSHGESATSKCTNIILWIKQEIDRQQIGHTLCMWTNTAGIKHVGIHFLRGITQSALCHS